MLKVNNRNTRTRCEICSKLTIKIPEQRQWHCSGIFIVNFEHVEQVNAGWEKIQTFPDNFGGYKKGQWHQVLE